MCLGGLAWLRSSPATSVALASVLRLETQKIKQAPGRRAGAGAAATARRGRFVSDSPDHRQPAGDSGLIRALTVPDWHKFTAILTARRARHRGDGQRLAGCLGRAGEFAIIQFFSIICARFLAQLFRPESGVSW
jgi:hypothetical protein